MIQTILVLPVIAALLVAVVALALYAFSVRRSRLYKLVLLLTAVVYLVLIAAVVNGYLGTLKP